MHEFRGRLQDLAAQKFHLAKLHQIRLEGRLKAVKAKRASDQAKASSANSKQWRPKGHRSQRRHQQGVEKSFLARSVHLLAAECCSNAWLWWRTLLCSALASCLALAGLLHLLCLHPSLGFPRLGWWFLARLACSFCFFSQTWFSKAWLSKFIFRCFILLFQDSVVQFFGCYCVFFKTRLSKFWFRIPFLRLGFPSLDSWLFFQNLVVQVVVYVVFPKLGSPSFGSLFFQDLVVQVLVAFLFSKTWSSKLWFTLFFQNLVLQVLVRCFSKTWLSKFWLLSFFPRLGCPSFGSLFFPRLGCPSFG